MISSFSELLTWSYRIKDMEQLILDNLDLKVDPENLIFKFKSNGVGLSMGRQFEQYKDVMESKIATGVELGEEDDGEEWVAYIVNAYLCFKDFDSYEQQNLTGSASSQKNLHSKLLSRGSTQNGSLSKAKAEEGTKNPSSEEELVKGEESVRKTLEPIFDDDSLMQTKTSEAHSKSTKRRTKIERQRQNSKSQERPNQI